MLTVLVDAGIIADAELDIVERLRHGLDVFVGSMIPGPQVYVHDDARGYLDTSDVDERDLLITNGDDLGRELNIYDVAGLEVHACYVINE